MPRKAKDVSSPAETASATTESGQHAGQPDTSRRAARRRKRDPEPAHDTGPLPVRSPSHRQRLDSKSNKKEQKRLLADLGDLALVQTREVFVVPSSDDEGYVAAAGDDEGYVVPSSDVPDYVAPASDVPDYIAPSSVDESYVPPLSDDEIHARYREFMSSLEDLVLVQTREVFVLPSSDDEDYVASASVIQGDVPPSRVDEGHEAHRKRKKAHKHRHTNLEDLALVQTREVFVHVSAVVESDVAPVSKSKSGGAGGPFHLMGTVARKVLSNSSSPGHRAPAIVLLVTTVLLVMMLCSTRPVSPVGTTPFSQWLGLAGSTAGSSEGQLGQAAWPQCKGFTGSCIQSLLPYARSASSATGWPIPLILAQWDVEHGGIFPDFDGYNFGNVRLTPFCSTLSSDFCNDTSPIDGLRDYEYVARLAPYNGVASAAQTGGVNAAALALGKSPWDAGHYVSGGVDGGSLLAALAAQNLYQYF